MSPPAFAKSEPRRRECHRLTSQISRYEGDVKLAKERGNELWEDATRQQIARLSERRASRCPQYREDKGKALREFAKLIKTAAKVAAKYFTMGAF
jgi:hypothetical protein